MRTSKKFKIITLALFLAASLLTCLVAPNSVLAEGGGWVGSADPTPRPGSGSGGSSGKDDCSNVTSTKNLESCNGYSWVFYKYNKDSGYTGNYYFPRATPTGYNANAPISSVCAKYDEGARGFWHLGRNGISGSTKSYSGYISDYSNNLGSYMSSSTNTSRYRYDAGGAANYVGHFDSIMIGDYRYTDYTYRNKHVSQTTPYEFKHSLYYMKKSGDKNSGVIVYDADGSTYKIGPTPKQADSSEYNTIPGVSSCSRTNYACRNKAITDYVDMLAKSPNGSANKTKYTTTYEKDVYAQFLMAYYIANGRYYEYQSFDNMTNLYAFCGYPGGITNNGSPSATFEASGRSQYKLSADSASTNVNSNNQTVIVRGDSVYFRTYQSVHRMVLNSDNKDEAIKTSYYVKTNNLTGTGRYTSADSSAALSNHEPSTCKTSSAPCETEGLTEDQYYSYIGTVGSAWASAKLLPGQELVAGVQTHFKAKPNDSDFTTTEESCNMLGSNTTGWFCTKFARNEAKFDGSVNIDIISEVEQIGTGAIPEYRIRTNDGSYSINMTAAIARQSDGAGGQPKYRYSVKLSGDEFGKEHAEINYASNTECDSSRSGRLDCLSENSRDSITSETLRDVLEPGGIVTICAELTYEGVLGYDNVNGGVKNQQRTASKCIKIRRDDISCIKDDTLTTITDLSGYRFSTREYALNRIGAASGENIGSVGIAVVNMNTHMPRRAIYSGLKESGTNTNMGYIYAKPSDVAVMLSVFCAGALPADQGIAATTGENTRIDYVFGDNYAADGTPNSVYIIEDGVVGSATRQKIMSNFRDDRFITPGVDFFTLSCDCGFVNGYGGLVQSREVTLRTPGIFPYRLRWTSLAYTDGVKRTYANDSSIDTAIRVPYNYTTTVTNAAVSADSGRVVAGSTISYGGGARVTVNGRVNRDVDDSASGAYATKTKKTKHKYFAYVVGSNVAYDGSSSVAHANLSGYVRTDNLTCSNLPGNNRTPYASSDCYDITGAQANSLDVFEPGISNTVGTSVEFTVPRNLEIGAKLCFVTAIYPADSHNNPGASTINAGGNPDNVYNAEITGGGYWSISAPTCRAVSKAPSMRVTGGGVYSKKGINAITSEVTMSGGKAVIGSWGQYDVVSSGNIDGFASGAALRKGIPVATANDDAAGGLNCVFSPITIANKRCASSSTHNGNFTSHVDTLSTPDNLAESIVKRYALGWGVEPSEQTVAANEYRLDETYGSCIWNETTKRYDLERSGYTYNYSNGYGVSCLDNGAWYTGRRGDGVIQNDTVYNVVTDLMKSRVHVTEVTGTLVIKGNQYICGEDGRGCTSASQFSQVPQVILIADKIVVMSDVTNIDAWLIANEIETCSTSQQIRTGTGSNTVTITSSQSCDNSLTINGPVFAKNLKLTRYGGGGATSGGSSMLGTFNGLWPFAPITGGGSSGGTAASDESYLKSAEVFNLNIDSYLWAYNQSSRYSQAYTTYSHELSPRL